MKFIVALASIAIATSALAQNVRDPKAPEATVRQAAEISGLLGLDAATTEQLTKAMMASSDQTTELRAQCAKIQQEVDAVYAKNMEAVIAKMTPAQQERYATAVKEGRIKYGACGVDGACHTGEAKAAGCGSSGKAETKAGGCCAGGKAHTDAKPADPKAAPEAK